MQRIMQSHAAVFRTGQSLQEGVDALLKCFRSFADVRVSDRSLIWNTDLMETLELDNLLGDYQQFTGRAAMQTTEFLQENVGPVLDKYRTIIDNIDASLIV